MAPSPVCTVPIETLARKAAAGDADAFGSLFDHYADSVVRYLVVRTHNRDAAQDMASATWERVARSISNYEYRPQTGGFPAWLFTITRHTYAETLRWYSRRPGVYLSGEMLAFDQADGADTPAEALDRKVQSHQIAAEIESLPPAQRKCILHRFFEGLTIQETAAVMGKTVGAVKQLQFRGLTTLRDRLNGIGFGSSVAATDVIADLGDTTSTIGQTT